MNWTMFDTWIVVVGALCAVACSLPGCFLVLRKMSMMGDAISHAVLPGLAAAFLITSSRASLVMFVGAAVVGILTAVFTQWVTRFGKVDAGAAMGIVFTTLFAIGLVLIRQAADHVDLDPGCVLYGAIETTPFDIVGVGPFELPRAAVVVGSVLLINLLLIVLLFKELRLSSFDPELATTLGINASLMHYLLMTMVAVTTVAAFESVGRQHYRDCDADRAASYGPVADSPPGCDAGVERGDRGRGRRPGACRSALAASPPRLSEYREFRNDGGRGRNAFRAGLAAGPAGGPDFPALQPGSSRPGGPASSRCRRGMRGGDGSGFRPLRTCSHAVVIRCCTG